MRFSVVGAGGWGTAVARLLTLRGHDVILWARRPEHAADIEMRRENREYLPDVHLPSERLEVTSSLDVAADAEALFLAVPSFAMAELCKRLALRAGADRIYVNLAKGIDRASRRTMSELIQGCTGASDVLTLSGPSHAEEVGRDMPTAVVLAGANGALTQRMQVELSTPRFRVYRTSDIRGVELCGTVKNIIALATGVSDGLGYGDNSRGALITRGLAEMRRFVSRHGVREATLYGLSGLGDLVATCTSDHSRNRRVGQQLGGGRPLEEILSEMHMVAEGIHATRIVYDMAQAEGIDMPITEAVWRLLEVGADPLRLVHEIMTRSPKREDGEPAA